MQRKLSFKAFLMSQFLILILGLLFIGGLYYIIYSPTLPSQSKSSLLIHGPITKEPVSLKLDLISPDDDLLTFQEDLEISGKTSSNSQVIISSSFNDKITTSKADGSFSVDFSLNEGVNELKIIVFDQNGDSRETERMVYFSEEKI